jgi:beta-phosphoglucomutase
MSKLQAVIFDMDGVIADTVELYYQANKRTADRMEAPFTRELNQQLQGISRFKTVEYMAGLSGRPFSAGQLAELAEAKNRHYKQLIQQLSLNDVLPGIRELLRELKGSSIKTAVASSSSNAFTVLERLALVDQFDFIVDIKTIQRGKPDPEIFMKAADGLGVPYANCAAIEDGEAGLAGIKRAGMFSVGVGAHEAMKEADWHVPSTGEITLAELLKRYGETVVS